MTVILVAAVAANGVIGADGDLAWRNSADLKRLKAMTMGHTLIMGRKNYEAIGRPLPGRRTVVLTTDRGWAAEGVTVVHDTGEALDAALSRIAADTGDDTFFIFGGGETYRALMDRADALELTEIKASVPGDVYFPELDRVAWREVARDRQDGFDWVRYERVAPNGAARVDKANFDDVYVQPDPRSFFGMLTPLDYEIPDHAAEAARNALAELGRPAGTVLDVCCSYGINAAVGRTDLVVADLGRYYADPARSGLSPAEFLDQDNRWYAEHVRPGRPRFLGLDASAPAIDYAIAAGLVSDGWAENLEEHEPSAALAAGIAEVDVVLCSGGIGYIGEQTFARIAAAAPDPTRMVFVSFALRAYDFTPIAKALAEHGLVTQRRPELMARQRRFANQHERDSAVEAVRSRGLDTTGLEDTGWFYADCFITRSGR